MAAVTPRPWIEAWHDALYGEAGFYHRDEGPAGHFATSAHGIPGVAEVLAQAVVAHAERCDAEVVVDFACGRGQLLETLAGYVEPEIDLVGVDVVERPPGLGARITWLPSPGGPDVAPLEAIAGRRALVLAHEWLDVVPCTIAERDDDGCWRQVDVSAAGEESLGAPLGEADLAWARSTFDDLDAWHRLEVGRSRDEAWRSLVETVRRHAAPGSLVLGVDYAMTAASASPLGTLTGFRNGVECPPVPDGSCDITSHVMLDTLTLTAPPATQRAVLLDLFGDAALLPVPIDLATSDPPAYLERLALRSAFTAATARDGLGEFAWFVNEIA